MPRRAPWPRLLAGACLLPVLLAAGPLAAEPGRATAAARNPASSASSTLRLNGIEYVEARAFFARYGLKASWLEASRKLQAASTWTKIELEADKREITLNGLRLFLGEGVAAAHGTLYVSRIDADKLLTPILRPASVPGRVPELKVIAVDAGHGGQDTGTQNKALKLHEKGFALDVARQVTQLLRSRGYKVVMTRDDDRFIDLEERAAIAKRAGADLFISIHFNSVEGAPAVRGTETFVMTPRYHRSTQPERDKEMIPTVYPGNKFDAWNAVLGYAVHRQLLGKLGTFDRGLKRMRFVVLRSAPCPSVLVEAGYLSNDAEARKIGTAAYRGDIAEAIVNGVNAYAAQLDAARK
ncbi:MAG TPA: N-acetylmuramoyl-L-alanine amidase [Opitutaceae bacterium]